MKDGIHYVHGYRCIVKNGKIDSCWHYTHPAYEITRLYREIRDTKNGIPKRIYRLRIDPCEISTDALRRGLNRGSIVIENGPYEAPIEHVRRA